MVKVNLDDVNSPLWESFGSVIASLDHPAVNGKEGFLNRK